MPTYQSFTDALDILGLANVVRNEDFRMQMLLNSTKYIEVLYEAIQNNKKILIEEDCDPDGYYAGKALQLTFLRIGYTNFEITKHVEKRHSLSMTYMTSIIEQGFELIMIVDSSSNDMEGLKFLSDQGIQVLIADHHKTAYVFKDYPSNVTIVNPKIDARFRPVEYAELSGCAVTSILMLEFLSRKYQMTADVLYSLAYITLYSDSCDMGNRCNRWIARKCMNNTSMAPPLARAFMTKWDSFDRNYISWTFIPRLNAMIRAERFDLVWEMFYDQDKIGKVPGKWEAIRDEVNKIYLEQRQKTADIFADCIEAATHPGHNGITTVALNNIAYTVLPHSMARQFRNNTGQIAQKIGDYFGKTGVCLIEVSSNSLEGSVRDTASRDIQTAFQTACYAEGHGPAFGIELPVTQLDSVMTLVDSYNEVFATGSKDRIVIDWDTYDKRKVKTPLKDVIDDSFLTPPMHAADGLLTKGILINEAWQMAQYNEFSGGSLPQAVALLTIHSSYGAITTSPKKSEMSLGTINGSTTKIISFITALTSGDRCLLVPTMRGSNVELRVEEVLSSCTEGPMQNNS